MKRPLKENGARLKMEEKVVKYKCITRPLCVSVLCMCAFRQAPAIMYIDSVAGDDSDVLAPRVVVCSREQEPPMLTNAHERILRSFAPAVGLPRVQGE